MLLLPADSMALLAHVAPLFSRRVWGPISVLVAGALLAPGRRLVSTVLRAVGWSRLPPFPPLQTDHRVLNRAVWARLGASRILVALLLAPVAAEGPLVRGIAEPTPAPTRAPARGP